MPWPARRVGRNALVVPGDSGGHYCCQCERMESSTNVRPNTLAGNLPSSRRNTRGSGIRTECKDETHKKASKEPVNSVVTDDGFHGARDVGRDEGCEAIVAAVADLILSNESERRVVENIRHWEQEALTHFKNSSWPDVIAACTKVLQVPGQSDTNFDIQYEIGYAYMRLEEYETALSHLVAAHRIDGQRGCLRMALRTLKDKMERRPWRKRGSDGKFPRRGTSLDAREGLIPLDGM